MNELHTWVEQVVNRHYGGAWDRLAKAIKVSPSAFGRGVKKGTLSVETLLKLANETGESAPALFARAKKGPIVELIERLFGVARVSEKPDVKRVSELLPYAPDELVRQFRDQLELWKSRGLFPARNAETVPGREAEANDKPATRGNRKGRVKRGKNDDATTP